MNNPKKDAGEARQRPRQPVRPAPETSGATPTARAAGSAPVFDADAGRFAAAREDAPRGMISNPWVKQWAAGTPEGTPEEAGPADVSVKELVARSGLSFTGTVEARGFTAMADLPADDRTVVVRVEEVLHGPAELAIPVGSRVTVQLSPDLPGLDPGQRATFFANGLAYGEQLAVAEVGRVSADEGAARTARMQGEAAPVSAVQAAVAELGQDEVVRHAQDADAIVRGRVVGLAEVPRDRPLREHDPHWWIATLDIDVVERGEIREGADSSAPLTVGVLYANSLDVQHRESPKPKAGQAGLWLLHRTPDDRSADAPFEITHKLDMQPSIQLDLLRARGI